jgi:5-methylcytosine-specific restriction endonuclease McrA
MTPEERRRRNRERCRRYYERNQEKIKARARTYHAEHREQAAASGRAWREKNQARLVAKSRAYYEANREAAKAKRYKAANKDKVLAQVRRRRAKKANAPEIRPYTLKEIAKRDGDRCHICRKRVPTHERSVDHLVALSAGGPDVPENVALAHRSCNSRMGVHRLPAQLLLPV